MGLFDGKVVIVTGAGAGLGEQHALAFAREGARVVVNDLGGTRDGVGSGNAAADAVVAAIRAAGGEAVASYDGVGTRAAAERIVKTALDAFGRLDVLVNNAGILRDKTLLKVTDEMWYPILEVHLNGTFFCAQAAAEVMLRQEQGGRIINTTSYAGLKGNFGQTNYASAKAGIAGFTRAAALELGRKGITVNAIAPLAKTRLTDDIDAIPENAKPEFVSPMVLFLASDLAKDVNGRVFGVHGNHLFEYVVEMTEGVDKKAEVWTPSEIAARFSEIAKVAAVRIKEQAAKAASAGGVAAVDPAAKALAAMTAMATALVPERAGDWKAVLHFEIAGAADLTMTVADGKAAVAAGKRGEASCLVKMDDATFFGMTRGEIDGTQAFMQGKITATNMRDMVKWGTSFDMKAAQVAVKDALAKLVPTAAPTGAPAPAADPGARALAVLQAMSTALVPERAGDWKAVLHFEIAGCGEFTQTVEGGKARAEKGHVGAGTCAVKMDAETFFAMAKGEIEGPQAFMQGKITATNMKDMIKWGTGFDTKKAQAAVQEALAKLDGKPAEAPKAAPAPEKPRGLNRAMLGRTYVAAPFFVRAGATRDYAHATNDPNPRYHEASAPGGLVAPPLFPVRILNDLQFQAMLDPELNVDFAMLLFGSQEMRFHSLVRPGDLIDARATISRFEEKDTGEIFDLAQVCARGGKVVTEVTSRFFVRKRGGGGGGKDKARAEAPQLPPLAFEEPMLVRLDQTEDYAPASGDRNPLHLDDGYAKAAGLKGRILHGLCSMAFSSQAFVKNACDGDPAKLRRLFVRFARPVFPGETVRTQAWRIDEDAERILYGFQLVNPDGVVVLSHGEAEVVR